MARGRGGLIGVLCFSLGSRLRGNDGGVCGREGICGFTLTPGSSPGQALGSRLRGNDGGVRGRGGLIGVLCFSLGSRLRGNDVGVRGNDGGCEGMTGGVCGFTLTPGSSPGQALALSHRGRGDLWGFSLAIGDRAVGDI